MENAVVIRQINGDERGGELAHPRKVFSTSAYFVVGSR